MDQFGEDPLTKLAFTIQANKGVYALLLGSGISSASGIKTGWGITCDLIARYAIGSGEKEPDFESGKDRDEYWANWYTTQYKKEPDYSDLLEKLGNTPQERQSIVKSYIEPSSEESEKGLKTPTEAHHAIAKLVQGGFIKVIITTNFDRLLEQALNNVGITPTVVASEDDLLAQEPPDHCNCYIVKVHGDYKDGRIKNTMEELSEYSDEYKALLKRIFNDYGLIVCGWSAAWDIALKQAIRSATSRRYSLFWASYSDPGEEADQIIKDRKGEVILINKMNGADGFFTKLQEKVEQIEKLSLRRPRTEALILSTLKDYLSEPEKNRIRINDLFKEVLTTQLLEFPEFHKDDWISRSWEDKFSICEAQTKTLAKIVGILGIYGKGEEKEDEIICNMIQTLCYQLRNNKIKDSRHAIIEDKTNLAYPAYLLFTIYALTLIQSKKWKALFHLLSFNIKHYYSNAYKNKTHYFFGYTQFEHHNKTADSNFISYRKKLMQNWGAEFLNELNFDFFIIMLDLLCFLTSIQFSENNNRINELLDKYKDHHDHYHNLYRPSWIAEIEKSSGKTSGSKDRLTDLDYPLGDIMDNELKSQISTKFSDTQFLNNLEKAGFSIVTNKRLLEAFINNNRLSGICNMY